MSSIWSLKKKDLSEELIKHIAFISTNSDEDLSEIITEAFVETGEDGIVDVQYKPNATKVDLKVKAGSYVPSGYTHQHFITNQRQRTCELEKPFILVSNATLDEVGQIEHILRDPLSHQRPIVIIADTNKNFNEAFVANVEKGNFQGCIIQPGMHVSTDMLRDLAELLGGLYFDNANGNNFDYLSDNYWGRADQVTIGQDFALFSIESNDHMKDRVDDLKKLIDEAPESHVGDYKARLSMLNGRYATITVGAPTQSAAFEVKDRLDDAVFAVGAAQKFGYLPGGGVALKDAANAIKRKKSTNSFAEGYNSLLTSIYAPMAKILENAGLDNEFGLEEGIGIDASNGETVNMEEAGIIDPAFVSIQAIINATSAATSLLSAQAMLIHAEEN